jgi:serine/threonine protein kinase
VTPLADSPVRSKQQPQCAPPDHESEERNSQLIDVAAARQDPDRRRAAFVDDTPTDQLLPSPQPPATTSELRVELAPGTVLRSRYVLQDVIGRGGTSILFRAKDLHRASSQDMAAEFVAIKLLRPDKCADPLVLARLKREFQQMQGLTHPGIVRVFDLDRDGDVWFISMQLVAGQTLKTWMETPDNHANALRMISACCEALEYAHSLSILHGDLKPSNVMVSDDGTPKLMDFGSVPSPGGLAAVRSDSSLAATPLYASPQILAGKSPEQRDDVYSLACLSYIILSGGQHPFGGRPSLEDGRATSTPIYVPAIPAGIFAIIERGLSAERERRQPSVREFLDDLTVADERHRADAERASRPVRDDIDAMRYPVSLTHAADRASHSASTAFFKKVCLRARGLTITKRAGMASTAQAPIATGFGSDLGSYHRAQPVVRLMALVFAIVGTAVSYPFGTHHDMIRAPETPPQSPITSPELVGAAPAQSETLPESRPVPHDSGVISFEASTIHASAAQPLVAIAVNRLPATRSRGAFLWRVERGTARPGIDYQPIEPQVVRFIEGQAVRTLFIPLINTSATSVQPGLRTFTVTLERVKGGPVLGRYASVTVAIDPPPASSLVAVQQAQP